MDQVEYLHLPAGGTIPQERQGSPFKAIIISEQAAVSDWRNAVCDWIVRSHCLYAMTWGFECALWHDCIDEALLALHDYGEVPDDDHVMTTWHDDEPLEEVFFFAQVAALHPTVDLATTLLIDVNTQSRRESVLSRFKAAIES